MVALIAALACLLAGKHVASQPFQPGSGIAPLGSLRTSDYDGPYNISMLSAQANEAQVGAAARGYKGGISDKDIIDFLVNVECLEGLFDTWGVFGQGFIGDLEMGGPTPKGARAAKLSEEVRTKLAEVALNEQGHALMTRHAGGKNPCPEIDFDKGFNDILAAAFKLKEGQSVKDKFGASFDPFKNDQNFIISMLTLEELGATGNKGLIGILTNPVLANAVAGLATSATAQATIERSLLWDRRDATIEPFGESAQDVFARISAYRDSMDGAQIHDQGIVNTDPRFIYVPFHGINLIPTDVRGLTYNRSPQQNINILTVGAKDGIGGFFPSGLHGKINTPEGYDQAADGLADWPACPPLAVAQDVEVTGKIMKPVYGEHEGDPVYGMDQLTQPLDGARIGTGAEGRGQQKVPAMNDKWLRKGGSSVKHDIPANDGKLDPKRGYCGACNLKGTAENARDYGAGAAEAAKERGTEAAEALRQRGAEAKEGAKQYGADAAESARSAQEQAADAAEAARQRTMDAAQGAKEYAAGAAETARQGTVDAAEAAKDAAGTAKEYVAGAARTAYEGGAEAAGTAQQRSADAAQGAKEYAAGAAETARQGTVDAADAAKDAAGTAGEYVAGAARFAYEGGAEAAETVQQRSADAAQGAKGVAAGAAEAVLEGSANAAEFVREASADAAETVRECGAGDSESARECAAGTKEKIREVAV